MDGARETSRPAAAMKTELQPPTAHSISIPQAAFFFSAVESAQSRSDPQTTAAACRCGMQSGKMRVVRMCLNSAWRRTDAPTGVAGIPGQTAMLAVGDTGSASHHSGFPFLSRFAKFAPEGFRRYLQILSFAHPKGATSGLHHHHHTTEEKLANRTLKKHKKKNKKKNEEEEEGLLLILPPSLLTLFCITSSFHLGSIVSILPSFSCTAKTQPGPPS
ncbi:hypothetical protein D4764_10G0008220 [Takifugu flavidus]|uniref:Uncharacterized protein n=1 Tax=Takifugu flavidus TaxID=433684 RepID=A0A5C6PIZ3_9TELE|nr:hypothetical protein D4764_10G0008220 [Takifugu flavidus]